MKRMSLFVSVLLMAALPSYAQSLKSFSVDVPFSFHAAEKVFPAGHYVVTSQELPNGNLGLTAISSVTNTQMIGLPGHNVFSASDVKHSSLLFHRYGENYFLSRVSVLGNGMAFELPISTVEVQVAKGRSVHPVLLVSNSVGR